MTITHCKKNILAFLLLFVAITICVTGCQQGGNDKNKKSPQEELREKLNKEKSPVLQPDEAMKRFQIENGFQIQLVASEPLVSAPVALSFDNKGRIWAVEMNAYMPDTSGNGEKEPIGKIVILEDKDHDGKMDIVTATKRGLYIFWGKAASAKTTK